VATKWIIQVMHTERICLIMTIVVDFTLDHLTVFTVEEGVGWVWGDLQ